MKWRLKPLALGLLVGLLGAVNVTGVAAAQQDVKAAGSRVTYGFSAPRGIASDGSHVWVANY